MNGVGVQEKTLEELASERAGLLQKKETQINAKEKTLEELALDREAYTKEKEKKPIIGQVEPTGEKTLEELAADRVKLSQKKDTPKQQQPLVPGHIGDIKREETDVYTQARMDAFVDSLDPKLIDKFMPLINQISSGYYSGAGADFSLLENLAVEYSEKTGIPKGTLFQKLAKEAIYQGEYLKQRGFPGILGKFMHSVGRLGWEVPQIMAMGKWGLPAHGAVKGGAEGGVPGAVTGGIQGALTHGIIKGIGKLPSKVQTPTWLGVGGAITPGDIEDRFVGGLTFAVLGKTGGSKRVTLGEFVSAYPKLEAKLTENRIRGIVKSIDPTMSSKQIKEAGGGAKVLADFAKDAETVLKGTEKPLEPPRETPVVPVEPRTKATPTLGKGKEGQVGKSTVLHEQKFLNEYKKIKTKHDKAQYQDYLNSMENSLDKAERLGAKGASRKIWESEQAALTKIKPEIPGKTEAKPIVGKDIAVEKKEGYTLTETQPFYEGKDLVLKQELYKQTTPEERKATDESKLNSILKQRLKRNAAIKKVSTGEVDLQSFAKTKGVEGAEQGVYKRIQDGNIVVDTKEAKMLMDESIPDLSTGKLKEGAFWFKKLRTVAGRVEKIFTPTVWMKNQHPMFAKLFDMWHVKDRATTREFINLKDKTILPWKKRLAKSGQDPKKSFERIGVYLTGKMDGGEAILEKMNKKTITESDLTPIEKNILSEGRATFDRFFERVNHARSKVGRKPLKYVEDYMTWMRNLEDLGAEGFNIIEDPALDIMKKLSGRLSAADIKLRATPFKYVKRSKADLKTRIELNFSKVFEKYAHDAMRHINTSTVIAKGRAYLEPFRVPTGETTKKGEQESINWSLDMDKPHLAQTLNEWINVAAGKDLGTKSEAGRLMQQAASKLNKNLALAILSGNARSALIQYTAIRGAVTEVSIPGTIRGVAESLIPSQRKFALKWSKVLTGRNMDIHVADVVDTVAKGKLSKVKYALGEIGLKPLQFLDMLTAEGAWLAYYKKNVKKFRHKITIDKADDFILRTQASGKKVDVAPVQREHIGRLFTLFQTFTIGEWNWVLRDVMGIKNPERNLGTNIVKAMRFMVATAATNALMEGGLNMPSPFPAPERALAKGIKEKKSVKEIIGDVGLELAEGIPVFGGAIKYSSDYRSQVPSPAGQLSADIMSKLHTIIGGKGKKIGEYDLELIGKLIGFPGSSQIRKFVSRVKQGMSIPKALLGVTVEKKKSKMVY